MTPISSGGSNESNVTVRKKRKRDDVSDTLTTSTQQEKKEEIWNSLMGIATGAKKKSCAELFVENIAGMMETWDSDIQNRFKRTMQNVACDLDDEQRARTEAMYLPNTSSVLVLPTSSQQMLSSYTTSTSTTGGDIVYASTAPATAASTQQQSIH